MSNDDPIRRGNIRAAVGLAYGDDAVWIDSFPADPIALTALALAEAIDRGFQLNNSRPYRIGKELTAYRAAKAAKGGKP